MKFNLSSICNYRNEKVNVETLNNRTYISTENMLPNKRGVVKATSLPDILQTQKFKKGDVLVSNIRPYFKKIWKAEFDGGCSNDVLVFYANDNIDANFLYYILSNDSFFNYSMTTSKGTKMPRGDKNSIMKYMVPDFGIETQRKIASILCSIDEKIRLNNKINNNLPPHLCVARIAATQCRQILKTDGCSHTNGEVSVRGGNSKAPQVFSSRRVA